MAVTKEDILESISKMTVMEVVDLISDMEEKFGVTAAAAVAAAPAAAGGGEAAEEKTEFDVALADMGSNCLLYTSPSPRDVEESRMPSSA